LSHDSAVGSELTYLTCRASVSSSAQLNDKSSYLRDLKWGSETMHGKND
jgi:hypothetical protein